MSIILQEFLEERNNVLAGNEKVSALPTGAIIMAEGRKFVFVLDKDAEHEHKEGDDHEAHEDEFAFIVFNI